MVRFKRNVPAKRKDRTPWRRFSLGWLFYLCLRLFYYWEFGLAYLVFSLVFLMFAGFAIYRYIAWFFGWE